MLVVVFLFVCSSVLAQPTLLPSSGVVTQVNQVFTYQANGEAVERFTLWIGTEPSGPNLRNIVDTGNLGSSDDTFTAPFLPTGTVHVRLRYLVAGTWSSVQNSYAVTDDASTAAALLSELGCSVGEIIRVTSSGWECVDGDTLAGTDFADEICRLFRYEGATPPPSLLCPSDNDRYVFVTQGVFNGEIGGLSNADAICQAEADQASLQGVYRAFLSEEYTPIASRLRLVEGVTYRKPNNTVVATNLAQFYDQNVSLSSPIDRHATGGAASGQTRVWTGNIPGGSPSDCNAWTGNGTGNLTFTGISGLLNQINCRSLDLI